jgi:hypothetical protein
VSIEVDPVDEVDGSGRATLRVLSSAACAPALGYFTAPSFRFEDEDDDEDEYDLVNSKRLTANR